MDERDIGRRELLAGAAGAGLLLASTGARAKGGDVPPTEDLMREHGVLRRLLLVYDEAARRLAAGESALSAVVVDAASIVRRFVEGYHEKLEEDFVFPKLEKAGKLVPLTTILRAQHAAGRKLTDAILKGKGAAATIADIQAFGHMYTPHAAWEDTELFPAYRDLFTEKQLDELGDRFEEQEHKLLGAGGFEGSLKQVGDLEKQLGIHDLAKYTPR